MDIEGEIRKALNDCVGDIKRRHIQAGQRATGRTMNALEVRIRREADAIVGEIWGMPYTGAWETGSRPARRKGTAASRESMVQNLKEWCKIRGLAVNDEQAQRLAKYLAWYIKRYGSKLYRNGGRRDIITPAIEATKQTVEQQLGIYYEQLITETIDNNFFNTSR